MASCWANSAAAREAARPPAVIYLDISAAPLPQALAELAREAGVSIGTEGSLPGTRSPALHGRMSVAQALARLLAGSGHAARQVGNRAWRIVPDPHPDQRASAALAEAEPHRPLPVPEYVDPDPIVVTAPKRAAALDDLPMAVSVLRLSAAQAGDAASGTALVAARSEGLAMTALGPGRNRLFLRGIADSPFNGESQSTVAVVFDETRLTYAAPDPDIRLVDVAQVEVLKGPQGSLYGTGALGGIYHIVTRRADPDDTSLSLAAGAERVAHGATGWNASGVANLPLVPGVAGVRLVGYTAREAGWIDSGPRKDSNQTRLLGGRANLGVEAGGGWRADLSGMVQLLESRDSRYVYAPGARARPAQLPEPHDNDMHHLSARLARSDGGLDITLSTGMSWHEVGDSLDATIGAQGFGLASPSLLTDERIYRVWDSEARIGGRTGGGLRWLAGLSHIEARQVNQWTLHAFDGASSVIDDDRRDTSDTALFGDVSLPLSGRFSIDGGMRLFSSVVVEKRRLPAGTVIRRKQRSGMTPSLALSWKPGEGQLVFLRYASAIRQGGSDIGPAGELEVLKSDELTTIEAGWRREIGRQENGRAGHLELGLFTSNWENLQSDMLQANGLIESENAGTARIVGAELSLDLPLTKGLRLEAGGNLISALLTRNLLGARLEDRRLPVVPRYTLRGALSHSLALGQVAVQLRAALRYVGPQRLSFDPVIDRPMEGYLEGRVEAEGSWNGLRFTLTADNLFGGSKDAFAFGNPLRFALARQYTPQRPSAVSLGISKAF